MRRHGGAVDRRAVSAGDAQHAIDGGHRLHAQRRQRREQPLRQECIDERQRESGASQSRYRGPGHDRDLRSRRRPRQCAALAAGRATRHDRTKSVAEPCVFPFPVLVADIGGTNARVALVETPAAPLEPLARRATADFAGLAEAAASLGLSGARRPRALIACGAGPLEGRALALTNAPWRIDGPTVAAALGLEQGLLLNDFEALALALADIPEDWTRPIGPPLAPGAGPRLVLGCGTGLGVGLLVEAGGARLAVPSEAGHVDFAPADAYETMLWGALDRVEGRITPESLLSGPGLARLHAGRERIEGRPPSGHDAAALTACGLADPAGPEAATLRHAWRLIGRFAGDLAITFLATGGVTIAGGVPPKIAAFLDETAFRAAFEAKAPVAAPARRIGTRLLLREEAAQLGLAAIARRPASFALDYPGRCWKISNADGNPMIILEKEQGVIRQIESAISAYRQGHFDVCITLAGAAEGMLADRTAPPHLFSLLLEKGMELGGDRASIISELNTMRDWLKHPTQQLDHRIEIRQFDAAVMLARAMSKISVWSEYMDGFKSELIDLFRAHDDDKKQEQS
ncbi:MAG: glucokinase [Methylobacteriaceae bacterium]|nr:glucokinase [Methylobacteriaceae bacterium]